MGTESYGIQAIIQSKGFALSFEPRMAGTVVCRASKGASQFQVLARSVADGVRELGRLLGVNPAWQACR